MNRRQLLRFGALAAAAPRAMTAASVSPLWGGAYVGKDFKRAMYVWKLFRAAGYAAMIGVDNWASPNAVFRVWVE